MSSPPVHSLSLPPSTLLPPACLLPWISASFAGVDSFRTCNLARIPARVVIGRPGDGLEHFKDFVLRMDRKLRANSTGGFHLFTSSAYGAKDMLFKDSTVMLTDVGKEKVTVERWLGKEYFDILETLQSCPKRESPTCHSSDVTPSLTSLILVILTSLMM